MFSFLAPSFAQDIFHFFIESFQRLHHVSAMLQMPNRLQICFFFCCLSDFWAMCCHSAMSTGLFHVLWIRLKHWYGFYSNLSNVRVKSQRMSHVAWHRRRCQAMQSLCVGLIFCLFSINSKLIASQNYKLNLMLIYWHYIVYQPIITLIN